MFIWGFRPRDFKIISAQTGTTSITGYDENPDVSEVTVFRSDEGVEFSMSISAVHKPA
jgi:hypothetical protein